MKVSPVSPLRCDTMAVQPALRAISMAAMVSVRVPIWFSLIRMELAAFSLMPLRQALDVGDEQVVADELDLVAQLFGQQLPAVPVVLGQAVLDGDDRDTAGPSRPTRSTICAEVSLLAALAAQQVGAVVLVDLAGGRDPGRCRCPRRACSRPSRWPSGSARWPRRWPSGSGRSRPRRRRRSDSPCSSARTSARGTSRTPQRTASRKVGAPTGAIMNSWKSVLSKLACAPPFMMFIIGTGSVLRRRRRPGSDTAAGRRLSAAARATAMLAPRMALAPSLLLFGVPSSVEHRLVDADLVERVHAEQRFGDLVVDVLDGLAARPCRSSGSCRRRAAPAPRARRWTRRTARPPAPSRRFPARPPPRRWGCRGNPGFRGR